MTEKKPDDVCTCGHAQSAHTTKGRKRPQCHGAKSKACPCPCPSFTPKQKEPDHD